MKIQLLPSTIEDGQVVNKQHLSCFIIDDFVAVDAGCISMSASKEQRRQVRDVVLTHAHIDHVAGLPLFIDDHFSELEKPVRVHASAEVIKVLKEHIFNWKVYPDFAELENSFGPVLQYKEFEAFTPFEIGHLTFEAIPVNHKVPSYGFIIEGGGQKFGITGDTAEMDVFWTKINEVNNLKALFIECAFPNKLEELAQASHHLTPRRLHNEIQLLNNQSCKVFAINLKPAFQEITIGEIVALGIPNLEILEVGRVYDL